MPPNASTQEFNQTVFDQYRFKPGLGIVEEVINASLQKVTLVNENRLIQVTLDGVQGWGTDSQFEQINADDQYKLPYKYIESKKLAEFTVLNKEVGIQISGLDMHGNLIGLLYYSRDALQKLYNELLLAGAVKLTTFVCDIPRDVKCEFEALEIDAQTEKCLLWKSLECIADENFQGVVLEVQSGDCIGVLNDDTNQISRINLAGVKAPSMGGQQEQESWSTESKEQMICTCLSKRVNVKVEFVRTTQNNFKL